MVVSGGGKKDADDAVKRAAAVIPKYSHRGNREVLALEEVAESMSQSQRWLTAANSVVLCGSEDSHRCNFWRKMLDDCPAEKRTTLVKECEVEIATVSATPPDELQKKLSEEGPGRIFTEESCRIGMQMRATDIRF